MLASNTLNAVLSDVSLSISVLTIPTPAPLRSTLQAASAVSALARSVPCGSHHTKRISCSGLAAMKSASWVAADMGLR